MPAAEIPAVVRTTPFTRNVTAPVAPAGDTVATRLRGEPACVRLGETVNVVPLSRDPAVAVCVTADDVEPRWRPSPEYVATTWAVPGKGKINGHVAVRPLTGCAWQPRTG